MNNQIDLKELRAERGWSRSDMASYFGVDVSTICRWENSGIPSRGMTRKALEREWAVSFSNTRACQE
ncbi:helix-turn-helix domain-containing protein [Martelella mediterranea]|uniref:helix-turn-helix domain-containing protein n=1 Tax=Martelella mediterranea TaxID=293089 RepID=UPI00104F29FD